MRDYWKITNDVLDREADDEDRAALEAWVCDSEKNADQFVHWAEIHEALRTHFQLSEISHQVGLLNAWQGYTGYRAYLAKNPVTSLAVWSSAIAATLLLTLWGAGLLHSKSSEELVAQEGRYVAGSNDFEVAATLTGAVDCRWQEGYEPFRYGEQLAPSTVLRLAEGLAQVTFESGAKVVLRGPSEFRLSGPSAAVLSVGQITAVVPQRATGFVVKTPCAEVIDLGTEFAVNVDQLGVSEVHVFKGEVVSRRRRDLAGARSGDLHLVSYEAASYSPSHDGIREFRADEKRFIREISPRLTESELPREPQLDKLSLWMAADLLVKTDSDNKVVAWRDVLCGDNQTPDDAMQPTAWDRPKLVSGAINGADGIRFDGFSSYLLTTPMETGPNQTITFVAKVDHDQPNYHTGSILSYNGPPHRDMTNLTEQGVLQIGLGHKNEVGNDGNNSLRGIEAMVYVGAGARAGCVYSGPVITDAPVIVSYVYDTDENKASVYLNGQLEGLASAPAPATATSRRIIGRHGHLHKFFKGDLGEVLIYDRALELAELQSVESYLHAKYRIKIDQK